MALVYLPRLVQRLRRPFAKRAKVRQTLVDLFQDRTEGVFRRQQTPQGARWPPVLPSSLANKQGPQILIETGRLYNSLTDPHAEDAVRRGRGRSLWIGTEVPYAPRVNHFRPFFYGADQKKHYGKALWLGLWQQRPRISSRT